MDTPMIELSHLQKISGTSPVLDIESLTVGAGEIVAIVGPVGSGKSELLALLTGQSRPTSGMVRVCGLDPLSDRSRLSQHIGVLFTENGVYERLSVRSNLLFHCRIRGLPTSRVDEVLVEVGLADQAAVRVRQLPPGFSRRLAFGRTILHHPSVLLLMEPFTGCDSASSTLLARLIRQSAEGGAAILILTREGAGLAQLCQAVYTLDQGRITRVDIPHDEHRVELPFKVPARQEGQVILVNPADILFASTEESQTCLHTIRGEIPSHLTMSELEERLSHNGFFRAHRGYLVNLQRVKAIIPYTRDSYTLILDDPANTEIPLSKTAARELRELLGY
jgi:ABC-2 type transport system ATP-binding protein